MMPTQFQNDPAEDTGAQRPCRTPFGGRAPSGMVVALFLIGAGLLLFLDNLGILQIGNLWQYWPVILIGVGVLKLYRSRRPEAWVVGFAEIGAGLLFLLSALDIVHINPGMLWPLILITIGVVILSKRLGPRDTRTGLIDSTADSSLQELAIFGGIKRGLETRNFLGGTIFAVFGGVEIDLRRTAIPLGSDPVSIDASAIFGGVVIRPPESCRIAMRGTGIFGGYEDKTFRSRPLDPLAPLLVITGVAVFGGVSVE